MVAVAEAVRVVVDGDSDTEDGGDRMGDADGTSNSDGDDDVSIRDAVETVVVILVGLLS